MMNIPATTANPYFVQSPGSLVSTMYGEVVMMSVQKGRYYNLGKVGGRIWNLLSEPKTIEGMADILTREYEVEHPLCQEQVTQFVHRLLSEDLIQIKAEA